MRKLPGATTAALLFATMIASAQSPESLPTNESETAQLWFVELSSPPAADGTAVVTLEREEADFHAAAAGAGIRYSESRHFRKLWNGLTVQAGAREVSKVRAFAGVRAVYPVLTVDLDQNEADPGNVVDLITALSMTGADIAQSELGLTGRGVKVAVIDSGIDYDHPDLGGCFGPGCRVEKGFDLVGDKFNANNAKSIIQPDPLPDDCAGHGTHVAGIIGANGRIKGVAPGVTFHAYRVFGCEGSTTADIILAAMEMALEGGADILNMSVGSALQWPKYPTAQASDRLVREGVTVVASMGNDAGLGLYGAAAPGVGRDVIAVASFDNTHQNLASFRLSPDDAAVGYIAATGAPAPPTSGSFPMVKTGTPNTPNDACAPLRTASLTGKVVLIGRGFCSFYIKASNAQKAGAVGVVLYNNVPGFVSPTVEGTPPITIPVVAITKEKGRLINDQITTGAVTMRWTDQLASEPNPTANLISRFSSFGPAADLSFKPDIGAPGGAIRSTYPLELGGYAIVSGTSMSSPHVAGAAALLLEARPNARPAELRKRFQNTARPQLWFNVPGFLDNVHRQGAGMLQIADAIRSDVTISPSSLALGEIESGKVVRRRLRIKRGQPDDDHDEDVGVVGAPVTYTLGHEPALATGASTFAPSFLPGFASVSFDAATVTLGGDRDEDEDDDRRVGVSVTIAPPKVERAKLFGGYITFTPDNGGPVLRVPYAGYNGDYQEIVALTPTPRGFPWLAKRSGRSFANKAGGATFTLQGDDVPIILYHLDHQVRQLKMEVFEVRTGRSLHFAEDRDFKVRNSTPASFFAFVWDGTTMRRAGGRARPVPNGEYQIRMSILKALGDPKNPAHFEHWTSPNIVIARPPS